MLRRVRLPAASATWWQHAYREADCHSCVGWVISSEIQPLETRCLGQGVTVFMSMINSAIIGQSFLTMLCTLEWGVYILFCSCQCAGLVFCIFFLPETKGEPRLIITDQQNAEQLAHMPSVRMNPRSYFEGYPRLLVDDLQPCVAAHKMGLTPLRQLVTFT